jgi:general secretion pathway protein I
VTRRVRPPARQGFTLIEALVALAILAVASAGLMRATMAHIDTVGGLQTRAIAGWVAENRLVELAVDGGAPQARPDRVEMLGRLWDVAVRVEGSEDPDLALVTVAVSPAGETGPAATLTGFVDTGSAGA